MKKTEREALSNEKLKADANMITSINLIFLMDDFIFLFSKI